MAEFLKYFHSIIVFFFSCSKLHPMKKTEAKTESRAMHGRHRPCSLPLLHRRSLRAPPQPPSLPPRATAAPSERRRHSSSHRVTQPPLPLPPLPPCVASSQHRRRHSQRLMEDKRFGDNILCS